MIGPRSGSVGGTVVAFGQLLAELDDDPRVATAVIDTARDASGPASHVRAAVQVLSSLAARIRRADVVVFMASARGVLWLGPAVGLVCRTAGTPWILRAFGGNLDVAYSRQPSLVRAWVRRTAFRADLGLLQSRQLVERMGPLFRRAEWLPNVRPFASGGVERGTAAHAAREVSDDARREPAGPPGDGPASEGASRFVYVGIVKPSKGIHTLIDAGRKAHAASQGRASVDVYGPFADGLAEDAFAGVEGVRYRGVLAPEAVVPTLRGYDALLLPTMYPGEGYPGAILEAFAAGIPVIATRWRSIPEIVDDTCGILIEPGSVIELERAMHDLADAERLARLRAGAVRKRAQFASERWTQTFVAWCFEVSGSVDSTWSSVDTAP